MFACTEATEKFAHPIPAVDHACNLVVYLVIDFNVTKITGKLINISKKRKKKHLNIYNLARDSKSLNYARVYSANAKPIAE